MTKEFALHIMTHFEYWNFGANLNSKVELIKAESILANGAIPIRKKVDNLFKRFYPLYRLANKFLENHPYE